jgi:hypothetical protein
MIISLLPPIAGSERDTVVVCLIRGVAIAVWIGINAAVGTTDNAVVTTVRVDVVLVVISRQRQWRQSIGCFHSLSATVAAAAAKTVTDYIAGISSTVTLPKHETTLVVCTGGIADNVRSTVDVAEGIASRPRLWTTTIRCYRYPRCDFGELPLEVAVGFELHLSIFVLQEYKELMFKRLGKL